MKNIAEQILEGLSKFYVGFQNRRVLKTMEEIEANTDEQNIPSALLLGEINNKLNGCSFEQEGNDFYIIGADAVRKKLGNILESGSYMYTCYGEADIGSAQGVRSYTIKNSGNLHYYALSSMIDTTFYLGSKTAKCGGNNNATTISGSVSVTRGQNINVSTGGRIGHNNAVALSWYID